MGLLWTFIPDEALPLLFAAGALLLAIGFWRVGISLMMPVLVMPLVSPFVESAMSILPIWLSLTIVVVFVLSITRSLATLLLGGRATDHMIGILAADLVRILMLAAFKFPAWVARSIYAAALTRPPRELPRPDVRSAGGE